MRAGLCSVVLLMALAGCVEEKREQQSQRRDSYLEAYEDSHGGDDELEVELEPSPEHHYHPSRPTYSKYPPLSHGPPTGPSHGPHTGPSGPSHYPHSGPSHYPHSGPSHGPHTGPSHGPPTGPSHYPHSGPPTGPSYGPPTGPSYEHILSPSYGPPAGPPYGRPPSPSYGPPTSPPHIHKPSPSYGPPSTPTCGPPVSPTYGPPPTPTYGPPPRPVYGTPSPMYGMPFSIPTGLLSKLSIHTILTILLKVTIFKLIVKFIAILCLLLFIPKFEKLTSSDNNGSNGSNGNSTSMDDDERNFYFSSGRSTHDMNSLTTLVWTSLDTNMTSDVCQEDVFCRIRAVTSYVDSRNTFSRLLKKYLPSEHKVQLKKLKPTTKLTKVKLKSD